MKGIDNNRLNRLPISFSIDGEFTSNDTRFLDITIDIMHTGKNFNQSNFDKHVVNDAIPTLYNTPILGYIHKIDGDIDFKGHEHQLVINGNEVEDKYLCVAYGVIPESSDIRWITKQSEDGKMREYLQATALLWTKFDDAIEIFERDEEKPHSMELELSSIQGTVDKDGVFNFTKFKFDGCCILGEGVQPAMISSVAVANFSVDNISEYIKTRLSEYSTHNNSQSMEKFDSNIEIPEIEYKEQNPIEGGNAKMDEKVKILEKYSLSVESIDFMEEDITLEEFEAKVKEFSEVESSENKNENADEENKEFEAEEPVIEFALEGQFKDELLESLSSKKVETEWGLWPKYSFVDYDKDTSEIYCFDSEDYKLYGFKFEVSGDKVEVDFDSKSRKKFAIIDFEEGSNDPAMTLFQETVIGAVAFNKEQCATIQTELDEVKSKYEALVSKLDEQKKAEEFESKTNLIEQFEEDLNDVEEFAKLKTEIESLTIEEIETKCFAMVGKKKATFSVKKSTKTQTPKIPVEKEEPENKSVSNVPYAHRFQ